METKKIVITGGANRIGRSIALELANYETQIVIHYSKSFIAAKKLKVELENLGSVVHLLKADLNNFRQTQGIISYAYKKMKGLNCLINNASIFENDNLVNFSEKSFLNHMNVNLKAPAILIRDFAKKYRGKDGNIVNIIDQRVLKKTPEFFTYSLAKMGLWSVTQTAAQALAPHVRVNGIAPGPTLKGSRQTDQHFSSQRKNTILERGVSTADLVAALHFILATPSLTGQLLCVDGGQHLAWKTPDILGVE